MNSSVEQVGRQLKSLLEAIQSEFGRNKDTINLKEKMIAVRFPRIGKVGLSLFSNNDDEESLPVASPINSQHIRGTYILLL